MYAPSLPCPLEAEYFLCRMPVSGPLCVELQNNLNHLSELIFLCYNEALCGQLANLQSLSYCENSEIVNIDVNLYLASASSFLCPFFSVDEADHFEDTTPEATDSSIDSQTELPFVVTSTITTFDPGSRFPSIHFSVPWVFFSCLTQKAWIGFFRIRPTAPPPRPLESHQSGSHQ